MGLTFRLNLCIEISKELAIQALRHKIEILEGSNKDVKLKKDSKPINVPEALAKLPEISCY